LDKRQILPSSDFPSCSKLFWPPPQWAGLRWQQQSMYLGLKGLWFETFLDIINTYWFYFFNESTLIVG
jgi:hypothetical protein